MVELSPHTYTMSLVSGPTPVAPLYFENSHSSPQPLDHVNLWCMIQNPTRPLVAAAPYVVPLVGRSAVTMSQMNLEMCTESLGSETGSYCFEDMDLLSMSPSERHEGEVNSWRELMSCRKSPSRSFPPPLSSISRGDGSCILKRTLQCDGRLVIEAVPVPSHNYLQASRHDGRLLLSFIANSITDSVPIDRIPEHQGHVKGAEDFNNKDVECEVTDDEDEEEEVEVVHRGIVEVIDDEDEEEEVEVVDRGIVEVKVSTRPQLQNGPKKVLRSAIVIIKLVGDASLGKNKWLEERPTIPPQLHIVPTATTALTTSSRRASSEDVGHYLLLQIISCFSRTVGEIAKRYCTICGVAASSDDCFSCESPQALPPQDQCHQTHHHNHHFLFNPTSLLPHI